MDTLMGDGTDENPGFNLDEPALEEISNRLDESENNNMFLDRLFGYGREYSGDNQ